MRWSLPPLLPPPLPPPPLLSLSRPPRLLPPRSSRSSSSQSRPPLPPALPPPPLSRSPPFPRPRPLPLLWSSFPRPAQRSATGLSLKAVTSPPAAWRSSSRITAISSAVLTSILAPLSASRRGKRSLMQLSFLSSEMIAPQSLWPLSMSEFPTTNIPCFARVRATLMRLSTAKKPIVLVLLERTSEMTMMSFSSPWKLSTAVMATPCVVGSRRSLFFSKRTCPK
mmetsp:Transcript_45463/g.103285  ORF Transcript_45463/g.103285 Transcript_45463/m.103285 type:complete len:224 (-) Transcript_45463:122-793(-)